MATILVVDDSAIFREPMTAALAHHGYQAYGASCGAEALEMIRSIQPDLVLLDLVMPGTDGWDVLAKLRTTPSLRNLPVIVLTATADRTQVLRARKYGVSSYLLKSEFSLAEMLERVNRHLSQGAGAPAAAPASGTQPARTPQPTQATASGDSPSHKPLPAASTKASRGDCRLTRAQTMQRIEECTNGRSLAGVVAEVVAMAGSPRTGTSDLAAVLKRDPVLSARVLQVANTAAFATHKAQITTIDESVRNIGLTAVRNIAASIGIVEAAVITSANGLELLRCWQHCFAVARVMDLLLGDHPSESASAYVVGLCHDLGEIILRQNFDKQYEAACQEAAERGLPLCDTLTSYLGMTPDEHAKETLSRLGLPEPITAPIREFHTRRRLGQEYSNPLARALHVADHYANGLMLVSTTEATVGPFPRELVSQIVRDDSLSFDCSSLRNEVLTTATVLARLSPEDESALLQPLLRSSNVRIWYTRPRQFARLDPLAATLELLVRPEVTEGLPPTVDALQGYHGLIVAAPESDAQMAERVAQLGASAPPILYLTADDESAVPGGAGITRRRHPLSLADLHAFISGVAEKGASKAAA